MSTMSKTHLISTYLLQIANGITPILALFYISNIFQSNDVAMLILIESLMAIYLMISLYSFEVSSSIRIVKSKGSSLKQNIIFKNTLFSRLFIYALSLPFFLILILLISNSASYTLYLLLPLGHILHNYYFFNTLKINHTLIIFVFISRVLLFLMLFQYVHNEGHVIGYIFIYSICIFFSGLISSVYIKFSRKISFKVSNIIDKYKSYFFYIKKDKNIMISILSISFYRDFNIPIISFLLLIRDILYFMDFLRGLLNFCKEYRDHWQELFYQSL